MKYLIEGELVDTYGGNFTYRDVWSEEEDDEIVYYEFYYGAKPVPPRKITDPDEINELLNT